MNCRKSAFVDFSYPGDDTVYGVIERTMPQPLIDAIRCESRAFRSQYKSDEGWKRWRWECWIMAPAWCAWLKAHLSDREDLPDFDVAAVGGEGEPEESPSGYRKQAHAPVGRHYWLLVGRGRYIFDPTAHQPQFESRHPRARSQYMIEGLPFPTWRRLNPNPPMSHC